MHNDCRGEQTPLTTAAAPTTPPAWHGWRRVRGGRWELLVSAETEAQAFRKLLSAAAGTSCDLLTAPADVDPNQPRKRHF